MIPIYGTLKSYKDLYDEPSWSNLGSAALSTVGDAGLIVGAGGLLKGAVAANAANKAVKAARAT